jgi:hypothetical protein
VSQELDASKISDSDFCALLKMNNLNLFIFEYLLLKKNNILTYLFGQVLRRTNTVDLIWRLSSFTGAGRPQVLYRASFQAQILAPE